MFKVKEPRVGDRVLVLGYPDGLHHDAGLFPIARGGTIATFPLVGFKNSPAFFVDGTFIPGSSGSPVFTAERFSLTRTNSTNGETTVLNLPMVLGVTYSNLNYPVLEGDTKEKKNSTNLWQFANIGIVYNTRTISATLDAATSSGTLKPSLQQQTEPAQPCSVA
jgi:hypothetical protein